MSRTDIIWYVVSESDHTSGPFSADDIISRVAAGRLTGNTLCCCEGMPEWLPLNRLAPFDAAIRSLKSNSGMICFRCECGNIIAVAEKFSGYTVKCNVCDQNATVPNSNQLPMSTVNDGHAPATSRKPRRWLKATIACLGILSVVIAGLLMRHRIPDLAGLHSYLSLPGADLAYWAKATKTSPGSSNLYRLNFALEMACLQESVAFLPDGKRIAWTGDGRDLRLWDAATGVEHLSFGTNEGSVSCFNFTSDSRWMVTGGTEGVVRLWETDTGKPLNAFYGHEGRIRSVRFLLGSNRVLSWAVGVTSNLRLWDTASGQLLLSVDLPVHPESECFSVSEDETRLVAGKNTFALYDTENGAVLRTFPGHVVPTRPGIKIGPLELSGMILSSNRNWVASWTDNDTIKVWDTRNGAVVFSYPIPYNTGKCHFLTADNRHLIWQFSGESYKILDIQSGKEVVNLYGPMTPMDGLLGRNLKYHFMLLDAARRQLYWAVEENLRMETGPLRLFLWDGSKPVEVAALRIGKVRVLAASLSHDKRRMATVEWREVPPAIGHKALRIWDTTTGEELQDTPAPNAYLGSVEFGPQATHLLSRDVRDRRVFLWGPTPVELKASLQLEAAKEHLLAFTPDGHTVASRIGKEVLLRDTLSGARIGSVSSFRSVLSAAFNPEGTMMVTADGGSVGGRLWDTRKCVLLTNLNFSDTACAFSRDGKSVFAGRGLTLRAFDVETGKSLFHLDVKDKQADISSIQFSPDGRRFVIAGAPGFIQVWDTSSRPEIAVLRGHEAIAFGAIFSPDGKRILSWSYDKTARLWDSTSGQSLQTLAGHSQQINAGAFSPDGKRAVTGGGDCLLVFWDTNTGRQLMKFGAFAEGVSRLQFVAGGRFILGASKGGEIKLWDTTALERLIPAGKKPLPMQNNNPSKLETNALALEQQSLPTIDRSKGNPVLLLSCGEGIKMALVPAPAGHYIRDGQAVRFSKPFYIGKYEVTHSNSLSR